MFLLIILSLQLLIAAATSVSSVEAKVPKILKLVDVLFSKHSYWFQLRTK